MNIETFDPKEPWHKGDPDFHICMKHQPTMVTYRSSECPLCKSEARVEKLGKALQDIDEHFRMTMVLTEDEYEEITKSVRLEK